MTCVFNVAGATCEKTCTGRPNVDPTKDPAYKTFKDLYNCIEKKCVIQLGSCQKDPVCAKCFVDDAPDYCYSVESFNSVIDCTMCSCTEKANSLFCANKSGPGAVSPPKAPDDDKGPRACSPAETIKGSGAVIDFHKCTDLDEVSMMVTEFDNNNFGQLDAFEACAHSYSDDEHHGGHTALGCMQILTNAAKNPTGDKDNPNAPKEAIAALANLLLHGASDFCDCAKRASENCPLCPSFMQFKTLLYESLDACQSLDEIDCDAWNEFYTPCRENILEQYKTVDFKSPGQCRFEKEGHGLLQRCL